MRNLRLHQLIALLLVTACGGESATVVEVTVASVEVTPVSASVEVGLTVQFEASAFDASGAPVNGQPVSWESAAPAVATVTALGIALGVTAGSTDISATIGGVTASQTLTVAPSACGSRTDVTLAPGQHLSFAGDECLLLPAGAAGDLYRVAIVRPDSVANASNTSVVTLDLTPVLTPTAVTPAVVETPESTPRAPVPDQALPLIDGTQTLEHVRMQAATRAFHHELRLRERALAIDPGSVLPDLAGLAPAGPALSSHPPPPATRDLFLDLTCSATATREPVQLIDFNDNLAIYQETAKWATDPISPADAASMLTYYDAYVKDMILAYWGPLPDTDGNGRLLVVTSPSLGENVAAAVYSGDFYPVAGPPGTSCAGSNEGEIIYFSGPLIVALDDAQPDPFALSVVAHEAKHVSSLYNGILRGGSGPPEFQDLWIEEGTAEISQAMSSRLAWAATGGPPLGTPVTRTAISNSVQDNGGTQTAEMAGVVDALAGVVYSLSAQPNGVIVNPDGAVPEHSFYSNSWHWHRFLGDAFGNAVTPQADSAFFRALNSPSTPAGGGSGEKLLTGMSLAELFEEFVVAISLQGTGHTPTNALTTWDFLGSADVFATPNPPGSYPWPVTADDTDSWDLFATESYTGTMGPSGMRFHDFRSSGSSGAQIQVTGADDGRIIVTRID